MEEGAKNHRLGPAEQHRGKTQEEKEKERREVTEKRDETLEMGGLMYLMHTVMHVTLFLQALRVWASPW